MSRNDHAILKELDDHPLQHAAVPSRDTPSRGRTIVIRQGSGWQSLAVLLLCLLVIAVVMLGHQAIGAVERENQATTAAMARFERKVQQLESGIRFDSARRQLLLGMRDHILKVNPRASLGDAYRYAQLALAASEKYPSVDPLLLLAIGTVESRYDPQAVSSADARGLYQIWPSSGRLLFRSLGWDYEDAALHDPEKNTEAAALYLDILFTAYGDPQMVLAEYNGGPLNAGYFRAGVGPLSPETRAYVPQVLEVYARLKEQFDKGIEPSADAAYRDGRREGKALAGPPSTGTTAGREAPRR
jgi:soluble lytic murein transglycosylase